MTNHDVRIAYLGPKGTYSESAAHALNAEVESPVWVERPSIPKVIEAVGVGESEVGVVPLRTADGDVAATLKKLHNILMRSELPEKGVRRVYITGYGETPIDFYLAAFPGTKISGVRTIISKQEAIDACEDELGNILGSNWEQVPVESTTVGARQVKLSGGHGMDLAALCSEKAMKDIGLVSLLERPIQKVTAFIRVGTEPYQGNQKDETAIMVRLYQDRPGQLRDITAAIAPINISDIHLMKNKRDSHGVARAVFMLRLEGDVRTSGLAVGALEAEFAKEPLYGVTQGARVDVLGTYPILQRHGNGA